MKNVLYISTSITEKENKFLEKKIKNISINGGMPQSSNKFHRLIMEGFTNNKCSVTAISGRNISYKTHRGILFKKHNEKKNKIEYIFPLTINLPIIKQIFNSFIFKYHLKKWLKDNKDGFIVIDGSYVTVLPSIVKTVNKKCKIVGLFADLYDYMAELDESNRGISRIIRKRTQKAYSKLDGYIFLTEAMNNKINKYNKPYIVMEGLVDDNILNIKNKNNKKDILMYAGSLQKKFGLKDLVCSYMKYENKNSELWIYGDGDYKDEIINLALKDGRIKYFGNVDNKEIVSKETEATFLINPRTPNYEFTKYSFPSKNMEYMLSGTPMIGYKLPGIPDEYDKYIIYVKEDLLKTIDYCFKNKEELMQIGKNAQKFVLKNKNKNIQTAKIIRFIVNIGGM